MNRIIIEPREYGKTTYLFNEFIKAEKNGKNLYIMDSATDHENKSLIRKIEGKYSDVITIDERDQEKVVLHKIGINKFIKDFQLFFPFPEIMENQGKILCFDLSYFLEKGHQSLEDNNDLDLYRYYRNIYNFLSEQIALSLILSESLEVINDAMVLTDEIEFPITDYNIQKYQKNIEFLSSVHPENSFGTFYNSFERIKIKQYKK